MNDTQIIPLEPGNRIHVPDDWAQALGLRGQVVLHKTPDGILVHACPPASWDEFFLTKLTIGSAPADEINDELEVTGDDLLF